MVDSPLTSPPCVECTRPVCPGVLKCEDLSVAWMLAIAGRHARGRGGKSGRMINPQAQRLWDVMAAAEGLPGTGPVRQRAGAVSGDDREGDHPQEEGLATREPTWTSGRAPLVVRARTLQRRLAQAMPGLAVEETSIPDVVDGLALSGDAGAPDQSHYRSFEYGLQTRLAILARLDASGELVTSTEDRAVIAASVETFHAAMSGWVSALAQVGRTLPRPETWIASEGWVVLPESRRDR